MAEGPLHVLIVLGTRPEAIKLAPLVHALREHDATRVTVVNTGQHREMLEPMLELFDIVPDANLDLQRHNQTLEHIVMSVLDGLPPLLEKFQPDVIVVQGDTSTTFAAGLTAFYRGIPVVHLEAGLRTPDPRVPFPEEMNRRLTSRVASLHLAPTTRAETALLDEGIDRADVIMSGNTVVDSLRWLTEHRNDELGPPPGFDASRLDGKRLLLVTGHRRESFGQPFRDLCQGLRDVVDEHEDLVAIYPVHLNPKVQAPVRELLADQPRIHLLDPVSYPTLVWLLQRADLVLTDSGGIQEEAPSFGVPVLVMREVTERMEAVEAGASTLVGTDPEKIRSQAREKLAGGKLKSKQNPFGDGHASRRAIEAMLARWR